MTHRIAIAAFAVALLLLPALLQAFVWTPINLLASLVVLLAFIAIVRLLPRYRWLALPVCALPIAVAPYPNWLWASNELGWHFRVGHKLAHFDQYALEFGMLYLVVALLLVVVGWALRPNNSFKPNPLRGSA